MTSGQTEVSGSSRISPAEAIERFRPVIAERWCACIRDAYQDAHCVAMMPAGSGSGSDLLSIACDVAASACGSCDRHIERLRSRIRTKAYSISDLFREYASLRTALVRCAQEPSLARDPQLADFLPQLCRSLDKVSQGVLRDTAEFQENVIEDCSTGFCQTDLEGRIVYANDELQRMAGRWNLAGGPLADLFDEPERGAIRNVFEKRARGASIHQQLHLVNASGSLVPVGIEFALLHIQDEPAGGYAFLTDLTRPIQLQNDIYDRFLLGIIRLDPDQRITYTNKSMRDMLGMEGTAWKGWKIDRIVPEEDMPVMRDQLKRRYRGQSDEYEIRLLRQDDGRTVPVRISASPQKDRYGKVIGTLGIVRSIVGEVMHQKIESLRNCKELLDAVSGLLRAAVPFDRLHVLVFSKDKRHVRSLHTYSPNGYSRSYKRWWEMTPAMLVWSERRKAVPVADLAAFYDRPEFQHLKSDPAVRRFLEEFRSFIYYPIFRKNDLVACLAIYTASGKPYASSHCRLLNQLPIDAAVLSALGFEENERFVFLLGLLKEISLRGTDVKKAAEIVATRIARHFEWESVALLKADRINRKITLLGQFSISEDFHIPEDFAQSLDEGILGEVYATGEGLLVGDVTDDSYKGRYKATLTRTRSELCLPIVSGDLFWLLDIEDSRANAFSEDEKDALQFVIDEIKIFMERTWLRS